MAFRIRVTSRIGDTERPSGRVRSVGRSTPRSRPRCAGPPPESADSPSSGTYPDRPRTALTHFTPTGSAVTLQPPAGFVGIKIPFLRFPSRNLGDYNPWLLGKAFLSFLYARLAKSSLLFQWIQITLFLFAPSLLGNHFHFSNSATAPGDHGLLPRGPLRMDTPQRPEDWRRTTCLPSAWRPAVGLAGA
jgi:hypothetical protein